MREVKKFPIESCFGSRENLEKELKNHNKQEDGRISLALNFSPSYQYIVFYNPREDKIILEINAENKEDLVKAEQEFFKYMNELYKIY